MMFTDDNTEEAIDRELEKEFERLEVEYYEEETRKSDEFRLMDNLGKLMSPYRFKEMLEKQVRNSEEASCRWSEIGDIENKARYAGMVEAYRIVLDDFDDLINEIQVNLLRSLIRFSDEE